MTGIIGLIAAMPQESRALLKLIKGQRRTPLDRLPAFSFSIAGRHCVLVTSGMGARRARQAAQILIDQVSPGLLVSFGIAGAVQEDLTIGDVVLVEAYCQLEHGSPGSLTGLAAWPASARDAAQLQLASRRKQLYVGTAITSVGMQPAAGQLNGMPHPVLEMETAGIAWVAEQNGIPLYSLRAISDGPNASIPVDLTTVMDEDANLKVSGLLRVVFHNPGVLLQSGRILRNTATAADQAALALMAALSHWSE